MSIILMLGGAAMMLPLLMNFHRVHEPTPGGLGYSYVVIFVQLPLMIIGLIPFTLGIAGIISGLSKWHNLEEQNR